MKSNYHVMFKHLFLPMFSLVTAIGLVTATGAQAHHADDSLELYPRDAADICEPGRLQIRVTVNGVTHEGIMKLELYSEDKHFLKKKGRLRRIRVPAQDDSQLICVDVPEPGSYAIAGYHDQDGDRKLDQKWDFTPKEPYGLSNNPKIKKRRMPKFDESSFLVSQTGTDITINLVDLSRKKDKNDDK